MYDKPIEQIIPNDEKLKDFPPKSGIRQGGCLLQLFNLVLKILVTAISQRKR
jgi:hypothetical protein